MPKQGKQSQIAVNLTNSWGKAEISLLKLKKVVTAVLGQFDVKKATVNVSIVNNNQIRRLNKKFLQHNTVTDCLSFDLTEAKDEKSFDLAVNAERALKEAANRGHETEAELALYITHGLLHNLGFDDSTQRSAEKMHDTENRILQHLGYGSVYNNTGADTS